MGQRQDVVTKDRDCESAVVEERCQTEIASTYEFVRAFVVKLVRDASRADDLVQETFLRAHKSEKTFKGDSAHTTWLCAIALNVVRDHSRETSRRSGQISNPDALPALPNDDLLEGDLLQQEMDSCIRQYVMRLPERQRNVIALHDIAGLKHAEIASALDISESNSRVILQRGRGALKNLLEENCELCFDDPIPCQRKVG
jgi:RNA polymerase sigma-70 factor (ECF subfamily)